jgi:hypothetical protein
VQRVITVTVSRPQAIPKAVLSLNLHHPVVSIFHRFLGTSLRPCLLIPVIKSPPSSISLISTVEGTVTSRPFVLTGHSSLICSAQLRPYYSAYPTSTHPLTSFHSHIHPFSTCNRLPSYRLIASYHQGGHSSCWFPICGYYCSWPCTTIRAP